MIGPPKNTPGFNAQKAWERITNKRSGSFKTSVSKGVHISNHLLRFAQVFIGYNLMGTTSATLTTPELYLTWCMMKGVKVHLGYWLAQACHMMTTNTARHLYTCHLLGAYLQRNVEMKIAMSVPSLTMCDPPKLFNVDYFFNKGFLYMANGEPFFYEIGKSDVTTVKKELEGSDAPSYAEREEWRREMEEVRDEISEVWREMQELKEDIAGLTRNMVKQSDRMAEAVKLIMRMSGWLEEKFRQTQQALPPRPSSEPKRSGNLISLAIPDNPNKLHVEEEKGVYTQAYKDHVREEACV